MTTATTTDTPASETTPVPAEPDRVSMFYDTTEPVAPTVPAGPVVPSQESEPGPSATPDAASAVSTDPAKTETPPGTEPKEKTSDDKGHAAAARRLGSENAELKREFQTMAEENKILKAKLDGTYQEPTQPTPEEIELRAEFKGRETASRAVAVGLYGAETVQAQVYNDDSPYKQLVAEKPWLHVRVARHAQPTLEALRVLDEEKFVTTYGGDPSQWVAKIEAALKPKLLDEFKKQSVLPSTGKPAPSVTESRGSGGLAREKSLEDLFYGKPATG